jgi:hypothetical protein
VSERDRRGGTAQGPRAGSSTWFLPSIAVAVAFWAALLAIVGVLVAVTDFSFSFFSEDPSTTADLSPFVGFLSLAGVLVMWGGAVFGVSSSAFVARARGWRHASVLLVTGLGLGYLAFDDLFLFHENVLPRKLGVDQELILGAYAVVALAILWVYRGVFLAFEWPLLALALLSLAGSVAFDVTAESHPPEEGLKLLGYVLLVTYLVRLGAHMLVDAYPLERGSREAAAGDGAGAASRSSSAAPAATEP